LERKGDNMKYYIVAVFECGCDYEGGLSSVEVVICDNEDQINDTLSRINLHSMDYQCTPVGASRVLIFEGRTIAGGKPAKTFYPYSIYKRLWNKRHKENIKEKKSYMRWLKKEKIFFDDRDHDKALVDLIKRLEAWKEPK